MTTTHETKAMRLMVLYRLRLEGRLADLSDIALAAAFETRRETIWKDRQALKRADALYARVMAKQPWEHDAAISANEAAARLGATREAVYGMIRGGLIHAHKDTAGRWRIPPAEIERLKRKGS